MSQTHIVPEQTVPTRLSEYCIGLFPSTISRNATKKAIKSGRVRINGAVVADTGRWVQPGMVIELLSPQPVPPKAYSLPLEVILEDEHLAVIHKPAGILVSGNAFRTIVNALQGNLKPSEAADALPWPRPVHRLDHGTSGLLLVAKTSRALVSLGQQFESRTVQKRYRAVVIGKPQQSGTVESPIDGKEALTEYQLVRSVPSKRSGHLSLLDLFPRTGRRHQLRIHMASLGHPILGDKEYGIEGMILKGKGMFLAAVELQFTHPVTDREVVCKIEQPGKFERFLDKNEGN